MLRVPKARPRSAQQIEQAAEGVLLKFAPQNLRQVLQFNVISFFEFDLEDELGIEPVIGDNPPGSEGCTDSLNKKCYICRDLYSPGIDIVKVRRLRATIAHELGHCFLHVEDAIKEREMQALFLNNGECTVDTFDRDDLKAYEDPEWQAWRFASALMMPALCFNHAVNQGRTLKYLKEAFHVNPGFVRVRAKQLRIMKSIPNG